MPDFLRFFVRNGLKTAKIQLRGNFGSKANGRWPRNPTAVLSNGANVTEKKRHKSNVFGCFFGIELCLAGLGPLANGLSAYKSSGIEAANPNGTISACVLPIVITIGRKKSENQLRSVCSRRREKR